MLGFGFGEILLIMVIALIVFGPRRLPEIGRTIGKALAELRKVTDELKNTIEREVHAEEFKQLTAQQTITPQIIQPPGQTVSRTEPNAPEHSASPAAASPPVEEGHPIATAPHAE